MKAFCYSIEKLTYDSVNYYFNSETVKLNLNHVDAKDSSVDEYLDDMEIDNVQ